MFSPTNKHRHVLSQRILESSVDSPGSQNVAVEVKTIVSRMNEKDFVFLRKGLAA